MFSKGIAQFVGSALIVFGLTTAYWCGDTLVDVQHRIETARALQSASDEICNVLLNAETGQRGFILTGSERYLEPYHNARGALPNALASLDKIPLNLDQSRFRQEAEGVIVHKMTEMARTVDLRRENGFQAALDVIASDSGREDMDRLRVLFGDERIRTDNALVRLRKVSAYFVQGVLSGLVLVALGGLAFLMKPRPKAKPELPL